MPGSTSGDMKKLSSDAIERGIAALRRMQRIAAAHNAPVRAVATSAPKRSPELPNIPTVQEGGVANFDVTAWNGLYAPAGTPDAIHQRPATRRR